MERVNNIEDLEKKEAVLKVLSHFGGGVVKRLI